MRLGILDSGHLREHLLILVVLDAAAPRGRLRHQRQDLRLLLCLDGGARRLLAPLVLRGDRLREVAADAVLLRSQSQILLRHRCELNVGEARDGRVMRVREQRVVSEVIARLEALHSHGAAVGGGDAHLELARGDDIEVRRLLAWQGAIRGNQRQSEAIRGNQEQSGAIRSHREPPGANQKQTRR